MQIDIGQMLWAIINILVIVFIVCFLYKAYRILAEKAKSQRMQQEAIINKLEEVIELNKKIIQYLSDK